MSISLVLNYGRRIATHIIMIFWVKCMSNRNPFVLIGLTISICRYFGPWTVWGGSLTPLSKFQFTAKRDKSNFKIHIQVISSYVKQLTIVSYHFKMTIILFENQIHENYISVTLPKIGDDILPQKNYNTCSADTLDTYPTLYLFSVDI